MFRMQLSAWPKIEQASGEDSWSGGCLFRRHSSKQLTPGEVTLGIRAPHCHPISYIIADYLPSSIDV